ncbi:AEC family transporter [Caulobacter sp. BP25]|uniref:AEC family transporter n=1 Tax=Caulobacter sp. BP25 TaxID=2048900 RepID=UPI000C12C220|nr:AEC family transporter [Caulobacter sp. BP25]PHY21801.1 transporter [Caulobacter sp. BP25]
MIALVADILVRVWPFFLLVGAGLVLTRLRLLNADQARGLSIYVYWIGFPALLIHSLSRMGRPTPELTTGLAAYAVVGLAVMAGVVMLGRALKWTKAEQAGAAITSGVGNSAFLTLPITAAVMGAETARLVAGVIAVDFVILSAAGVGLLGWAAGRSVWRSILQAFRNPVVAAAFAGVALALLDLKPPEALDRALSLAAASGSPVGLVALGAALGLREAEGEASPHKGPIATAAFAKLALFPLLAWFAIGLTLAPPAFRVGATLLAAAPTAVSAFIQTRAYDVFARGAARTVALTTALALLTLAVAVLLLTPSAAP